MTAVSKARWPSTPYPADDKTAAPVRPGAGHLSRTPLGHGLAGGGDLGREGSAAALKGLHPFTKNELDKLGNTSEWLLENRTPGGARAEAMKKSAAEDGRDRLWTLLVQRHPNLRRIGYYFHGEDFEAHTPKLQSRVSQSVLDEEPAPGTPVPAPQGG